MAELAAEARASVAPDPYAGLRSLSVECWACLGRQIQAARFADLEARGGGVFDDIGHLLRTFESRFSMVNLVWWARYGILQPFADYANARLVTPLAGTVSSIPYALGSFVSGAGAVLAGAAGGAASTIAGALGAQSWGLGSILTTGMTAGAGIVGGALAPLRALVAGAPAWLTSPAGMLAGVLAGIAPTAAGLLQAPITALGLSVGSTMLTSVFSVVAPLNGLLKLASEFKLVLPALLAGGLGSANSSTYSSIKTDLRTWWSGVSPMMRDTALDAIEAGRPVVEALWSGFTSLPGTYLDFLATTAGTDLAMQPARALATTGTLYGMSIAAGSAAHVLSATLNLIPTLNWVGASQLSAFVAEAAAFTPLTNATYGVLLNEVLAVPLRYHWNQQLRPRLPTEGEIFTMGRKHGISYGEFQTAMAYQGIPDWWIDKMYDFFWTDPSPMWLLRMVEGGVPRITNPGRKGPWLDEWIPNWRSDPMAWLRMKLMLSGYEDVDIGPMIEGMTSRGMQSPVTQFKTSVRAMVRDAYWTEADAGAALAPYNVRAEEVHLLYLAEELDYQKEYLDDQVMYYKEAFRKGLLSEQDLTLALSTIYTRQERVAQEVARERVRATPTPKATAVPKEPAEITRLRTQAISSWTKQYRDWKIDDQDLLLGLTIVVGDAELAAGMVEAEITRYREPPPEPAPPKEDAIVANARRQAIATWTKAFREGTITSAHLELYLADLIPDADTRTQLVGLEQLRYNPAPELLALAEENKAMAALRAEYVRAHIELFQKRLISLEQLYTNLLADGLEERLARATAITQANKRLKVPSPDSLIYRDDTIEELAESQRQPYEEAYIDGRITLEQYAAWLQTIVQDADVASYMADVAALRRFTASL
jgi:hypothetical protein